MGDAPVRVAGARARGRGAIDEREGAHGRSGDEIRRYALGARLLHRDILLQSGDASPKKVQGVATVLPGAGQDAVIYAATFIRTTCC